MQDVSVSSVEVVDQNASPAPLDMPVSTALPIEKTIKRPSVETTGFDALGRMHSEFGRILPTRDLDGLEPYLDPLEPIPRKHVENAAAKAGIRPDDIDAQVASLSAHLGWDVRVGAKSKTMKRDGRQKLGRKRQPTSAILSRIGMTLGEDAGKQKEPCLAAIARA